MRLPPFSSRKIFVRSVTALVSLSVIGWGLWALAAVQYRRVIDNWIEEGRAAGYLINYDDRVMFGFPRHITMRLVNLRWKNADGIYFRTDDMDINARPWDWRTFEAKFKNHVMVAAPLDSEGKALILSCAGGQAHVELDKEGYWQKARLDLDGAQVGLAPNYLFRADKIGAAVERPEQPPEDHTQVGLTIKGEAENIILPDAMPSPFGNQADKVALELKVMGRVPDVRKRADVDAWNKDSGVVEFEDFSIKWGSLDITAKGTLGFDDDLQPEGAFVGAVADPKDAVKALIDKGFIAMHDQNMISSVMDMFAKPSSNAAAMELPISVQLGGLFLGPVRIFMFPEIEWPVEPPKLPADAAPVSVPTH